MFTGIVEGRGRIRAAERRGEVLRLSIEPPPSLTGLGVGDSISVSGVCLTITGISGPSFEVEVSEETLRRTNLGSKRVGDLVNLERALEVGSRVGGHLVTGHVDGVGMVTEVERFGETSRIRIRVPGELSRYLIEKGSVAVEGVSLTVNELKGDEFRVDIIPYTAQNTTLSLLRVGDEVNVEVDIIGKYIEKFLKRPKGLDEEFLREHGFL